MRSGLAHALGILRGVKGVALEELTKADVVRHELVGRIIDASIFPANISGNTNAASIVTGWKGADMVLEDAG